MKILIRLFGVLVAGCVEALALAGGDQGVAVRCWGSSAHGQCTVPPSLSLASQISGGFGYFLALDPAGRVTAWGDRFGGQCDVPSDLRNVRQVAAGFGYGLALLGNGTVTAWGNYPIPPVDLVQVERIAAGAGFAYAILSNGSLRPWGNNTYGQCNMQGGWESPATRVACGWQHAVAVTANGRVYSCGVDGGVPPAISDAIDVTAGMRFSVVLRSDGSLYCWGDNMFGQCAPPVTSGISAIASNCVSSITAALLSDGRVITWGVCNYGSCETPSGIVGATSIAVSVEASAAIVPLSDVDGDGRPDSYDNCPSISNASQADCDGDGVGDSCDAPEGDINGNDVPDYCECIADLFVDQAVNGVDLGALLAYWGPTTASSASQRCDFNLDGAIDGFDLGYLLSRWGPCTN